MNCGDFDCVCSLKAMNSFVFALSPVLPSKGEDLNKVKRIGLKVELLVYTVKIWAQINTSQGGSI